MGIASTPADLASLDQQLNSDETPLAQRFRALFTLKSIGSHEAIDIIGKGACGLRAFGVAESDERERAEN
jgi:hypothetical protein